MKKGIKFTKQSDGSYSNSENKHILWQIHTVADFGISRWALSKNEHSEPYLIGSFNECKSHLREICK